MALPLVEITGKVLTPAGTPAVLGRVDVRLSQPMRVSDGAVVQLVAAPLRFDLGADGAIPSGALKLVPNDAGTPTGTYYLVTFAVDRPTGGAQEWKEKWQVPSGEAQLDIGEVPRIEGTPPAAYSVSAAVAQAIVDEATGARDDAAASALSAAGAAGEAADSAAAALAAQGGAETAEATAVGARDVTIAARDETLAALPGLQADVAAVAGPAWDEAVFPIVLAHRGTGNIAAPENTWAAFDYASGLGVAIETDVQSSVDGGLVLMHDETVDRTTGVSAGAVKSLTYDQLLVLDAAQGYRPDLFSPQRVPAFDEFLRRYGRTRLLAPEIKAETDATGTAMAAAIKGYGMQRGVLGYSFWPAQLAQVAAVDPTIKRVRVASTQISAATAAAEGLWGVAISQVSLTSEYVATMKAAGFKVFTWTVNTIAAAERFAGWGADCIVTDDPAYLHAFLNRRTPLGTTTVNVPPSLAGSGWRASTQTSGVKAIVGGYVTFSGVGNVADSNNSLLYVPLRAADAPAVQTITTTLKVEKGPTSGNTARFLGLRFAWTTDDEFTYIGTSATNGYYVAIRLNGTIEIARVTAGAVSVLGSSAGAAVVEGQAVPIRIDITDTTITVTRTDTGQTYARTDATHPRGGFISAFGSGVIPGIGPTTLTY